MQQVVNPPRHPVQRALCTIYQLKHQSTRIDSLLSSFVNKSGAATSNMRDAVRLWEATSKCSYALNKHTHMLNAPSKSVSTEHAWKCVNLMWVQYAVWFEFNWLVRSEIQYLDIEMSSHPESYQIYLPTRIHQIYRSSLNADKLP